MRTCAGRGCAGGRSASRGGTSGASSVGAGSGSPGRGCTMRASSVGAGGRRARRGGTGGASSVGAGGGSASRGSAGCASAMRTCAGSAVCARAGRRSSGCAVGSAASAVGGAASIRIHERVVVSAVRRAGGSVRGSRVPAGASIASCGRMRRRGGLSRTRHTVGAVARIRGRKSRILDIRTTVRGMAGVTTAGCLRCGSGLGCAGGSVLLVSRRGESRVRISRTGSSVRRIS